MSLKLTRTGTDGKTYWLAAQMPEEKAIGACGGCAFNQPTCHEKMRSAACATDFPRTVYVWKEQAPTAYGCDAEVRGQPVCQTYCGSPSCVTNGGN